jgi:hypothetical protein
VAFIRVYISHFLGIVRALGLGSCICAGGRCDAAKGMARLAPGRCCCLLLGSFWFLIDRALGC